MRKILINKFALDENHSNMNIMKFISFFLSVCFIVTLILSLSYISANENHIHQFEDDDTCCNICINVARSEKIIKQNIFFIAAICFTVILGQLTIYVIKYHNKYIFCSTLVSLKIKLSD